MASHREILGKTIRGPTTTALIQNGQLTKKRVPVEVWRGGGSRRRIGTREGRKSTSSGSGVKQRRRGRFDFHKQRHQTLACATPDRRVGQNLADMIQREPKILVYFLDPDMQRRWEDLDAERE